MRELPTVDMPKWRSELTPDSMMTELFPLTAVLTDSLYYPSSAFDGDPIRHLAGNLHSFVYVDYGYDQKDLEEDVWVRGFLGYRLLGSRAVTQSELVPGGWNFYVLLEEIDGDTFSNLRHMRQPFCRWYVFERMPEHDESHGPLRSNSHLCCWQPRLGVLLCHA